MSRERLRALFLGLALASTLFVTVELVTLRHWNDPEQIIPFGIVAGTAALAAIAWRVPTRSGNRLVRVGSVAVAGGSLYGVIRHVVANYDAGPLDFRYADRWATMSAASRWWAAATEAVGASPVLAPLALVNAAIFLVLATVVLSRHDETPVPDPLPPADAVRLAPTAGSE